MAKRKRQKVKRYRRSYYSRQMRRRRIISAILLVAVVLVVAWFAAPHVLDWATHTWYTVVKDRDLDAEAASQQAASAAASEQAALAASSQAASSQAASSRQTTAGTQDEDEDPLEIRDGSWSVVSLSALSDEAAIRTAAKAVKDAGALYALIPLKDTSGYIYYESAVPAASGSIAAATVDPALIASVFRQEGLIPVASLAAFQDPIATYTVRSMAIQYSGEGNYLWLDAASAAAGGKAWLNPYNDAAVEFIGDLIEEVHGFGFAQICLTSVQFPSAVSSKQDFGVTGGVSRAGQLTADIAVWNERFADEVTIWYEYPLASCTSPDSTTGVSPAQLGVEQLVIRMPAGEAPDEAAAADAAALMKEQGAAYVVVRDSATGGFSD